MSTNLAHTEIRARIGDGAIDKITRMFPDSLAGVFIELLQNGTQGRGRQCFREDPQRLQTGNRRGREPSDRPRGPADGHSACLPDRRQQTAARRLPGPARHLPGPGRRQGEP